MHNEILDNNQARLLPLLKNFQKSFLPGWRYSHCSSSFHFPYLINHPVKVDSLITMPTLLSLAAMKAFALGLGQNGKIMLICFFILKYHYSILDICRESENIFGSQFSGKLFREQLAFHKDIDYSEPIEYLVPAVPEDEIKNFLIDTATDIDLF